ncbi:cytochrome C oxidase subunit IV family protein [Gordonia sp. PKS22-38]|uniref:Cytochrome C oxidase subunit IV family protein n=1 Tax=Gordonia prachuapensis TaxID=3115651 RepID=A0ABU7MUD3_9ACTN|nr:cytochrome C oxidase subunit IV family protein [Gordonia sp. PKS22-38]
MTLSGLLRERYVRTWIILVLLAVVGPILSVETHVGSGVAVVVLALAAYKVRLVGLDFMEIREARKELRWIFEGYCVALWAVLAGALVVL